MIPNNYILPPLEELIVYASAGDNAGVAEFKLIEHLFPCIIAELDTTLLFVNYELKRYAGLESLISDLEPTSVYTTMMNDCKNIIDSRIDSYTRWMDGFHTALYVILSRNGVDELRENDEALLQAVYTFCDAFIYYSDITLPKMNKIV